MAWRPIIRKFCWFICLVVFAANAVMFFHAWKFTHFSDEGVFRRPEEMSASAKLTMMFTGFNNPKSGSTILPELPYKQVTFSMPDGRQLDAWDIPAADSGNIKGTVLLFHGFKGYKASMLKQAAYLHEQGYNTLLTDFTGHGQSKGNYSTLGYYEAEEVEFVYNYIKQQYALGPVILLGSSMGAVAISRAVGVLGVKADKLILEAPFGSMVQAVNNRCAMAGIPSSPMAEMIVFWGSAQQGFWGFNFSPADYAKTIKVPTLLLYGRHDRKVTMPETQSIYNSLSGEKHLHVFEKSAHCSFLDTQPDEWKTVVDSFLN